MNRTSIRRAVVPGIAVLALALTGCGAGNEQRRAAASGAPTAAAASAAPLTGGGATSQEAAQRGLARRLPDRQPRRHHHLRPGRLRHRSRELHQQGLLVRRLRLLPQRRRGRAHRGQGALRRRGPDRGPGVRQPDRGRLQPRGRRLAQPRRRDHRRRSSTARSPPGTTRRSPRTTTASTCPTRRSRPVHRSDDSGTTENFTDYLSKAGDGAWTYEPDGIWPIKGGEAAEGTSGVVAAVKGGEGTIGYADESQAGGLGIVSVKVGEEFNAPSAEGAAKVARGLAAGRGPRRRRHGHRHRPHHDRVRCLPGLLASYLIACQTYDDANEADAGQGLPLLHRLRGGPAGRRRRRPARRRSTRRSPTKAAEIVGAISAK